MVRKIRWAIIVGLLSTFLTSTYSWPQAKRNPSDSAAGKIDWNAPMPSAAELKKRVIQNVKQFQAEQERYICNTTEENDFTDKNGNIKRRDVKQYQKFFVNGQEIDELTAKNGRQLNTAEQKKEQKRVEKQIQEDSDAKYVAKQDADNEKQLDMLLHMVRYTNGHRIDVNGRAILAYDMSGDPTVQPKGMEETFLHDMSGTIRVDEATGELVDLNAHLDHDVKVGGGLLADLHKGFWIHVRQQRYPDGIWLPDLVEGTGDARAALFFHPYFKFSQTMQGCVRTNVTTSETASKLADPAKTN